MNNDPISRSALLETIRAKYCAGCKCYPCSEVIAAVEVAPAVDAEPKWISAEDRLPDKTGKYLVFHHEWSDGAFLPTYEDYTIRTMQFMNNNKWRYPVCVDKRCEADTHREVTHWMPLPEPPMCGRPLKGE